MTIDEIRKQKGLSMYELSRLSGVPYATVHTICAGEVDVKKCQAETIYNIAQVLNVSVESILTNRASDAPFTHFRSIERHRVNRLGGLGYIEYVLTEDPITAYADEGDYAKALYVLSMTDYLSRLNDLPLCNKYAKLRGYKLSKPLYPSGVLLSDAILETNKNKDLCLQHSIAEFRQHNIIEPDDMNMGEQP